MPLIVGIRTKDGKHLHDSDLEEFGVRWGPLIKLTLSEVAQILEWAHDKKNPILEKKWKEVTRKDE